MWHDGPGWDDHGSLWCGGLCGAGWSGVSGRRCARWPGSLSAGGLVPPGGLWLPFFCALGGGMGFRSSNCQGGLVDDSKEILSYSVSGCSVFTVRYIPQIALVVPRVCRALSKSLYGGIERKVPF